MLLAARWAFGITGIYGMLATLPLYLRPAPAEMELWYLGFVGAAAATQLLYLLIAIHPLRLRPAIPVGIASKVSFGIPALILYSRGTVDCSMAIAGLIDFALAAMFLFFFLRLPKTSG